MYKRQDHSQCCSDHAIPKLVQKTDIVSPVLTDLLYLIQCVLDCAVRPHADAGLNLEKILCARPPTAALKVLPAHFVREYLELRLGGEGSP